MMEKLGIYIHIPFCARKCAYCDFLSAPADADTITRYLKRLMQEIENEAPAYRDYEVVSVFIGGGTPSLLPGGSVEELMHLLYGRFRVMQGAEITMEANPGTLTTQKLSSYKRAGINRLSIGLQSADDEELKRLGRIHTYAVFLESYRAALDAGFENINIDLMSALPGQSVDSYQRTLDKVLELHPKHISAYSLIIEEGTPFHALYGEGRGFGVLPGEEEDREMYAYTEQALSGRGYGRYEISNYAQKGYECRHNMGYWTRRSYAGFGLGASSLVNETRWRNSSALETYLQNGPVKEDKQELSVTEQMEEFMFLGLRLAEGVAKADFQDKFGVPMDEIYGKILQKYSALGYLCDTERVYLNRKGMDVSSYIMSDFLLG